MSTVSITLDAKAAGQLYALLGLTDSNDGVFDHAYQELGVWLDEHHPDEIISYDVYVEGDAGAMRAYSLQIEERDPTPYCAACGARRRAARDCGPIAANN